jgi:hypothetical protein
MEQGMSAKQVFIVGAHPQSRGRALEAVRTAPDGHSVTVAEATRTLEQNAAQWPILEAFAEQLQWPVNGEMVYMTAEDWKDTLTAAFKREEVRLAKAFDGPGVVMLGQRTSKFPKGRFSDWLEFLHAAAAHKGVVVYPEERIAA